MIRPEVDELSRLVKETFKARIGLIYCEERSADEKSKVRQDVLHQRCELNNEWRAASEVDWNPNAGAEFRATLQSSTAYQPKYYRETIRIGLVARQWSARPGVRLQLLTPETAMPCFATVVSEDAGTYKCRPDNEHQLLIDVNKIIEENPRSLFCQRGARSVHTANELSYDEFVGALGLELPLIVWAPGQRLLALENKLLVGVRVVENLQAGTTPTAYSLVRESDDALGRIAPGAEPFTLELNPLNSCVQRFSHVKKFREAVQSFNDELATTTGLLEDAVTGSRLRTADQLLAIEFDPLGVKKYQTATDILDLCEPMTELSPKRIHGTLTTQPVLVCAKPGTGKTWCTVQLANALATRCSTLPTEGVPLVPVLLYAQKFVRMLRHRDQPGDIERSINHPLDERDLLQFFARQHADRPDWIAMLTTALELRSMVILIDGIDEAGSRRDQLTNLIVKVLVPMGLRVFCTSRPEGVQMDLFYNKFVVFNLRPLSKELQAKVLEQHLANIPAGKIFADNLMSYANIRVEHDRLYTEETFPNDAERDALERFEVPDKHFRSATDGKKRWQGALAAHKKLVPSARKVELMRDPTCRTMAATPARPEQVAAGIRGDFIKARELGEKPQSKYLNECCEFLTSEYLMKLDAKISKIGANDHAAVDLAVTILMGDGAAPSNAPMEKMAARLGKLVLTWRSRPDVAPPAVPSPKGGDEVPLLTAAYLWPRIVSRVDELYCSLEDLLPAFRHALRTTSAKYSLPADALVLAPLKDPVRIHEKAVDEYADAFDDGVLPEACVHDVMRATIIAPSAAVLIGILMDYAKDGGYYAFTTEEGDRERLLAHYELIRCKNTFHSVDPNHFRTLKFTMRMSLGKTEHSMRYAFVEIQVMHKQMLEYHERAQAHVHYSFFKRILGSGGMSVATLDRMLERMLVFLEGVRSVPVLLSMLVLIFQYRENAASNEAMPTSLFEMYRLVLRKATNENQTPEVGALLRHIALANQSPTGEARREFGSRELDELLDANEAALFNKLVASEKGVPLVKTLNAPVDGVGGLYQFRHLSFQEGMAAVTLIVNGTGGISLDAFLNNPSNANLSRIGGKDLGAALLDTAEPTLSLRLTDVGAQMLSFLLPGCTRADQVRCLDLTGSRGRLGDDGLRLVSALLAEGVLSGLESLRLPGQHQPTVDVPVNALRPSSTQALVKGTGWGRRPMIPLSRMLAEPEWAPSLTELDLYHSKIGSAGMIELANAVSAKRLMQSALPNLKSLILSANGIRDMGLLALVKVLNERGASALAKLIKLDLGWNLIGVPAMRALAECIAGGALPRLRYSYLLLGSNPGCKEYADRAVFQALTTRDGQQDALGRTTSAS